MDLPRRVKALVLAGSMLAMFMSALEQSIVGPALPRIVSELGGLELYPWLFQAYITAQVVAIPVAARLSDRVGRKRVLVAGLAVFLAGSAACGAAPDIYSLIAFRAVQGAGAGILATLSFAVVGDLFPPSERGRYVGLFGGVFALSSLIGAPLGGVLTELAGWRWVFWAMLPAGVCALALIALRMPSLKPRSAPAFRFDFAGLALMAAFLLPVMFALTLAGSIGWDAPLVLGLLLASAASLALFIAVERRAVEPIVPLRLFRIRNVAVAAIAMLVIGLGMFGSMVYLQFFLQVGLGADASTAGAVMGPMVIFVVVFSVIAGQTMSRTGRYKFLAVLGAAAMLAGMALLAAMSRETPVHAVLLRLGVFGAGMGMLMPVLTLAAQNAASQRDLGTISGFTQFFQLAGGAIGIGVIGALFNARLADGLRARLDPAAAEIIRAEKLVDPIFRENLVVELGADAWAAAEPRVQAAVAAAITDNFALGAAILALVFLAVLWIRELPLRTGEEDRLPAAPGRPPTALPDPRLADPLVGAIPAAQATARFAAIGPQAAPMAAVALQAPPRAPRRAAGAPPPSAATSSLLRAGAGVAFALAVAAAAARWRR